jgi:NAD-dependent DNA ligase
MTLQRHHLNQLYMAYLEHSVRYYEMDQSFIPDALFDRLCQALLRHWDGFEHSLKHLTDKGALRAGTGFQLVGRPELARVRSMIRYCGDRTFAECFGKA